MTIDERIRWLLKRCQSIKILSDQVIVTIDNDYNLGFCGETFTDSIVQAFEFFSAMEESLSALSKEFFDSFEQSVMLFTNPQRSRHYGLRPGDVVEVNSFNLPIPLPQRLAIVIELDRTNNNGVVLQDLTTGELRHEVAEFCRIIKKVEDRQ